MSAVPFVSTVGFRLTTGTFSEVANAGHVDHWDTRCQIPFKEELDRSDSTRESLIELDLEELAQIPGHPLAV